MLKILLPLLVYLIGLYKALKPKKHNNRVNSDCQISSLNATLAAKGKHEHRIYIEERSSQKERVFVFGVRFKANNPVTTPDRDFPELASGMSVYARHLAKAIKVLELAKPFNTGQGDENPDYSKLRHLGKSIRTVFLYYMVFSAHPDKMKWWQETARLLGIQLINFKGNQRDLGYKVTNARNSLYAFLPKTFTAPGFAPAFKKLAIVIVTSRSAGKHRHQENEHSLVNLFGRVIMLERVDEHTIELSRNFLTFADNLVKREIDRHPKILIDTVHRLYDEYGVRDVLYIAKTPFSSHLNLTQKLSQKTLYFMSETI